MSVHNEFEREFRIVAGSFFLPKMKFFSVGLSKNLKLSLGKKSEKGQNMEIKTLWSSQRPPASKSNILPR